MLRPSPAVTVLMSMLLLCLALPLPAADKKKVVLQLTDATPEKQVLVLNVADNLVENFQGQVEIEVVAFGPGLRLMFADNPHSKRITDLAKRGIRFSACANTHRKMAKLLGQEVALTDYAREVEGGAMRILELIDQGYVLIRP